MIPQFDETEATDVWIRYTLSTLEKDFGSHGNEIHVQRLKYIRVPGIRRSSERLHWHAHQDRGFVPHMRLYTGSKNEEDYSTLASVKGEIKWKKKTLTDWEKDRFVFSEADGNLLLSLPFFKNCVSPSASNSQSSISVSSMSASIWAEVSLLAWDQSKAAGCATSGLSESASVWKELGRFHGSWIVGVWMVQWRAASPEAYSLWTCVCGVGVTSVLESGMGYSSMFASFRFERPIVLMVKGTRWALQQAY